MLRSLKTWEDVVFGYEVLVHNVIVGQHGALKEHHHCILQRARKTNKLNL